MKNIKRTMSILATFALLGASVIAQTTAFNFQGRLNDGANPANGAYDLQFKLFDGITAGNQVGATVDRPNLTLINGVFSTTLDFGAAAFASGNRFLEISVRPFNSPNAYVVLGARQQILSVPLAVRAANATLADNATNAQNAVNATNSQNSVNATNAVTAQNSLSLGGVLAGNFARLNFANQGDVSAANLETAGNISVGGNAIQSRFSTGLVKAMIYVRFEFPTTELARCYNGTTGASTPATCGFVLTQPLGNGFGVYHINFGFSVSGQFVLVTVGNREILDRNANFGANFRFNGNNLEVFTFLNDLRNDTNPVSFMVIVY